MNRIIQKCFIEFVNKDQISGESEIGIFEDKLTLSWFHTNGDLSKELITLRFKVNEAGLLSEKIWLANDITHSEIYTGSQFDVSDLILDFVSRQSEVTLLQNEPNPFSESTNISFEIPSSGNVKLLIKNSLGQRVKIYDDYYESGLHKLRVDRQDLLHNGLYSYELLFQEQVLVRSMILID